jgi:adenosylhomocysteine nucleosidase
MKYGTKNSITAVVLSALTVEFRAVRAHLASSGMVRHPAGTLFDVGRLYGTRRLIAAAVTGEGNHSAAVIAERAVAMFHPRMLLFVGVAGSLRPDVRLGDIVVATHVYAYHSGREEPDGFFGSPRCWEASHELTQRARLVDLDASWRERLPGRSTHDTPSVHLGGIAAGEVVLNSRTTSLAVHIHKCYGDAIAIEMESAGVAQAAHLNRTLPMLTIRAISDGADGNKTATDEAGWQVRAAANAAAFAAAVIADS